MRRDDELYISFNKFVKRKQIASIILSGVWILIGIILQIYFYENNGGLSWLFCGIGILGVGYYTYEIKTMKCALICNVKGILNCSNRSKKPFIYIDNSTTTSLVSKQVIEIQTSHQHQQIVTTHLKISSEEVFQLIKDFYPRVRFERIN